MRHLDAFLALLCGRFDNARQLEELKQHALEVGGNSILDLRNQFQL